MAKKKEKKPPFSAAPKKGKKATFGHAMGGMFGAQTPKKPEKDMPSPTRAQEARVKNARMARLSNKLI